MSETTGPVQDAPPQQAPQSEFQAELIAAGARPNAVDVEAMYAEMMAMKAKIEAMEAERGIPSDPVAAAKQDLELHIKARAAQYPLHDFSEVLTVLGGLPEVLTSSHTALVSALVTEVVSVGRALELHYLPELAGVFHKLMLKKETAGV